VFVSPSSSGDRGGIALALLAWSPQALAQTNSYKEKQTSDGQAVTFDDDPLGALDGQPIGQQLWGFRPPLRCDLMRPRTNFVPELLKTVEKM
jgi:hypothetical protein